MNGLCDHTWIIFIFSIKFTQDSSIIHVFPAGNTSDTIAAVLAPRGAAQQLCFNRRDLVVSSCKMTPSLHGLQLGGSSSRQLRIFVSYATATHANGTFHHIYTPAGVNGFSGFEMHVKSLNEPIILSTPSWDYLSKCQLLMAYFHFLVCLTILFHN